MKPLLFGVLTFALGVAAGAKFYGGAPVPEISPDARTKLQQLTEADFEEYYRLKSAEEKYQKADEILGKVMAIFLADLGLHVSKQAQSAAHEKPPAFAPQVTESRAIKPAPAPLPVPPPAGQEPGRPLRIGVQEKQLIGARNENDVNDSLAKTRIADFDSALRSSVRMTSPNLVRAIAGRFSGSAAVRFEGKPHYWAIEIDFQGGLVSGQVEGHSRISLSEDGHVFSASEGKGTQSDFRQLPGDPYAMLIKASPTIELQLYYLPDLDRIAGNIYRRNAEDASYTYIGPMILARN